MPERRDLRALYGCQGAPIGTEDRVGIVRKRQFVSGTPREVDHIESAIVRQVGYECAVGAPGQGIPDAGALEQGLLFLVEHATISDPRKADALLRAWAGI